MAPLADFENHRPQLWSVAYRITGSVADADDALQEAWLRWQLLPDGEAANPAAYLTTVVSRICFDQLGSARSRRETYVGPWLPEPVVGEVPGPEDRVALDESVGIALLTVLEKLTPAERTAFILHDVFSVPFTEIAEVVGKTPTSVRQSASRARKRVRGESPRCSVDRGEHRRTVEAFLAAVMNGDFETLLSVLDPDVVWRSDGGGKVSAARRPVCGRENVARFAQGISRGFDPLSMRVVMRDVNGAPGIVSLDPAMGRILVFAFTVHEGRITEVYAVANPDKLRHLDVQELCQELCQEQLCPKDL
ncbi:sigma-70 family RNA polymerase sigma factor [Streptomyces telluris]|uniref:Sigma-70 family RNA polymerase sigma factor n=1 Tax=Streptomyces telluris TaxID=2720021 RepID=A0A9X2LPU9_9ACTN|nr:sigma-70 family RNA polymerase sigma factor [Streptomyces telluris]MCQ8775118.1 sigma-70 family RNA polymerase sigma factor [Streptomyces telluris]NJP80985.1 sigma-70 family RNA polymerase sigma factor [Streptomyces telluris]